MPHPRLATQLASSKLDACVLRSMFDRVHPARQLVVSTTASWWYGLRSLPTEVEQLTLPFMRWPRRSAFPAVPSPSSEVPRVDASSLTLWLMIRRPCRGPLPFSDRC